MEWDMLQFVADTHLETVKKLKKDHPDVYEYIADTYLTVKKFAKEGIAVSSPRISHLIYPFTQHLPTNPELLNEFRARRALVEEFAWTEALAEHAQRGFDSLVQAPRGSFVGMLHVVHTSYPSDKTLLRHESGWTVWVALDPIHVPGTTIHTSLFLEPHPKNPSVALESELDVACAP